MQGIASAIPFYDKARGIVPQITRGASFGEVPLRNWLVLTIMQMMEDMILNKQNHSLALAGQLTIA